jgi:hypothetical protein
LAPKLRKLSEAIFKKPASGTSYRLQRFRNKLPELESETFCAKVRLFVQTGFIVQSPSDGRRNYFVGHFTQGKLASAFAGLRRDKPTLG